MICKIVEKIKKANVIESKMDYSHKQNTALYRINLAPYNYKDTGSKNDLNIIFLNIAKEFDKVNHKYLITTLANQGINAPY